MKILILGGSGTIGIKVASYFSDNNDVKTAGRKSGDVNVDLVDSLSIERMFETLGKVDAVICAAGEAKWDDFRNMTEDDFYIGIKSKLMGQVNLVRIGQSYLNQNGSITLSSGILADDPTSKTTSAAMVNGAVNSFVKAVALEMTDGKRVNVVSSGLVSDSYERYQDYFPGYDAVPMRKVVNAYAKCVYGKFSGRVVQVDA